MKRKFLLFILILNTLFLTSCAENDELAVLKGKNYDLQIENKNLRNKIESLQFKYDSLNNEYNQYKENNRELKSGEIIASTEGIGLSLIDGRLIQNYEFDNDNELIVYNDELYISSSFIKKFYGLKSIYDDNDSEILIKGYPFISYLIKTDSIIPLHHSNNDEAKEKYNAFLKSANEVITKTGEGDMEYIFEGLTIGYYEPGNVFEITSPLYMTNRGITVGSTRDEVRTAYGQLGANDENTWSTFFGNIAIMESSSLSFTFENDIVVRIIGKF